MDGTRAASTLSGMRAVLATIRYWLPIVAGLLCLVATAWVGPIAGWLLIILAFGLILDGGTAMFEKAGRTGGISDHRQ
jgi:hypothetical protein